MKRQINTQVKISHSNILIPQERNITFGFETDFMSNTKSLLNVSFRIVCRILIFLIILIEN